MRVERAALMLTLWMAGCHGCVDGPVAASGSDSRAEAGAGVDAGTLGTDATPVTATTSTHATTQSATTQSGTTESGTTKNTSETTWGFAPDLPPFPAACHEPTPTIVVERAQSPTGELLLEEVILDTDWCTDAPALRFPLGQGGDALVCLIEGEQPLSGLYDCRSWSFSDAQTATVEVLQPYEDPSPDHASDGVHLHAILVAQGGGWDLRVEVDVPDCGEHNCYCPCE